jgi:hypothetical protein
VLKAAIGANIKDTPWGGGNKFAISLAEYLRSRGWEVSSSLDKSGIDIVLLTEPRRYSESSTFNQLRISRYIVSNPDTIVVHRINNCDAGRNTINLNRTLARANSSADATVFISDYLRKVFIDNGYIKSKNYIVIKNGADTRIFNRDYRKKWDRSGPLKLVTHHWSSNYNKGFDIYRELDSIVASKVGGIDIEFCYIGNIPRGFKFKNTTVIPPLDGESLAREIKKNHVYITGAIGEGAGMHHIEAALCGLPLVYRDSGALPEYCDGFGVKFQGPGGLTGSLKKIIDSYEDYYGKMEEYSNSASNMVEAYENYFLGLEKSTGTGNRLFRRARHLFLFLKELLLVPLDILLFKLKRF